MPPASRGRGGIGGRSSQGRRGVGGGRGSSMRRFIVPLAMLAAFIVPPLLMWRIRKRERRDAPSPRLVDLTRDHGMPSEMEPDLEKLLGLWYEEEAGEEGGLTSSRGVTQEGALEELAGEGASSPSTATSGESQEEGVIEGDGHGPGSPGFPLGKDDIHVVFSSDCTNYQAWQAVVLFHSAVLSGHLGPITQLVSGCDEEYKAAMIHRHEITKHSEAHNLYFTESFSVSNPATGEDYPYMNKPNAMLRWVSDSSIEEGEYACALTAFTWDPKSQSIALHAMGDNETTIWIPETVIALIDPDFLFLKPLTPFLDPHETVVRGDGLSLEGLKLEGGGWVREGHPAGQRFALPSWVHWDSSKFCPKDTMCASGSVSMAKRYYDLIPPYLAHKEDWRRILPLWVDQAPKIFQMYPSLLAEQTAYATACASLDLKHYRINSYAIENEKVDYELWDAVDHNMENVCDVGIEPGDNAGVDIRSFAMMPTFIHYCHMYRVGQWLFNKRRYRKEFKYDQLSCESPLLENPPMAIQNNNFKMHPGARYESITPRAAKRNAFMMCVATRFVNSALRRFKEKMCTTPGHRANFNQTVRIS